MARFNRRMTAGIGVFAAFLLLGAPTAAVAQPGGSHSDRGNNSDRGNDRSNGRGAFGRDDIRRGSNDEGRRGNAGIPSPAPPGAIRSPQIPVGPGRASRPAAPEPVPTIASRPAAPEQIDAPTSVSDASESRVSASDASDVPTSASDASAFDEGGPPSRSGSDRAEAPEARLDSPRATVGSGREPVIRGDGREPQWQVPAFAPVPPAPPPALPPSSALSPPAAEAPPPLWVDRAPHAPVLTQPLIAPATDWSDPLWGLAGLLLIPVAGAVLGYRQARAAHAVEGLRRA